MMTASLQPTWNRTVSLPYLPEAVVAFPIKEGYELVQEDQILYCKAEGNYTQIRFIDGNKLLISRKLKDTSASLQGNWFLRIHQSYLVNLRYARQYIRRSGGQLVMENGDILPISKNQKETLLNLFKYV